MEPTIGYAVLTGIFAAGAAWGGSRAFWNGTKNRVEEVHRMLSAHIKEETDNDKLTHERLAKVETKVDMLSERVKGNHDELRTHVK
jgi:hypothetical protein